MSPPSPPGFTPMTLHDVLFFSKINNKNILISIKVLLKQYYFFNHFQQEICIKHPLHRKKLQLALRAFNNTTMEKSSELDHIWVTRMYY